MKNERYWLDIESGIIFDAENEKDFDPINKLNEQDQQISDLQKESEVLRRALRLSCEMIGGMTVWKKEEYDKAVKDCADYFIQQAKEQRDERKE